MPPKEHWNMGKGTKHIEWNRAKQQEAIDLLLGKGNMIVSPTKVGYIIMTSDIGGLKRKFSAKQRAFNKPGVVLCGSIEQLRALAQLNDVIGAFYQRAWDDDVLVGCILPWKSNTLSHFPDDGSREMMMDSRGTSCFVNKVWHPLRDHCRRALEQTRKASICQFGQPFGERQLRRVAGISRRISDEADLVMAADEFVGSIQPGTSEHTRYEQGVMVSMVDTQGKLTPAQKGNRLVQPGPIVIRKGLDINKILSMLSERFPVGTIATAPTTDAVVFVVLVMKCTI